MISVAMHKLAKIEKVTTHFLTFSTVTFTFVGKEDAEHLQVMLYCDSEPTMTVLPDEYDK